MKNRINLIIYDSSDKILFDKIIYSPPVNINIGDNFWYRTNNDKIWVEVISIVYGFNIFEEIFVVEIKAQNLTPNIQLQQNFKKSKEKNKIKDHGEIKLSERDSSFAKSYWYNEDKTINITVTDIGTFAYFLVCFETSEGPIYQNGHVAIGKTLSFQHGNKIIKITNLHHAIRNIYVVFRLIEETLS